MRVLTVALLAVAVGCNALPDADRGEIYDLTTRQPIAGARLTAHRVGKSDTVLTSLYLHSTKDGQFEFERESGARISHVVAEATGYYPAVGIRRGRIYLRPVPSGARPAQLVTYKVEMDAEDVGLRLRDGAIVAADEADIVVRVRTKNWRRRKVVLVRARGGLRRVVSPMRHGIALEPLAAFDNIVEVPKERYTRRRTRGTSTYGWTVYATYAVRTRVGERHAKILVAAEPDDGGDGAVVTIRYRLSDTDESRFVATTN